MRMCAMLFCVATCSAAWAGEFEQCGPIQNAFGPYDYRYEKGNIPIVENNHFTPDVENLVRGVSGSLGGDIDYTLRAFPNHHRALQAMARLGDKLRTHRPPGAKYTVACYFERAVRFRPDDGMVRALFAIYLDKHGKSAEALQQLQAAEKLAGEDANLHYNMGLVYLNLKDYDNALLHAHRAYELGFPLPGLRNRLERAGKWREAQKQEPTKRQDQALTGPTGKPSQDTAR